MARTKSGPRGPVRKRGEVWIPPHEPETNGHISSLAALERASELEPKVIDFLEGLLANDGCLSGAAIPRVKALVEKHRPKEDIKEET